MLIDVNILLYAEDSTAVHHQTVRQWWDAMLSDEKPIMLSWPVITGFLRIVTNPKILAAPLTTREACSKIDRWLAQPYVTVVAPGKLHWQIFTGLTNAGVFGNLIPDAHLAALAIEHDCELASCDADFARFPGLKWLNPLNL